MKSENKNKDNPYSLARTFAVKFLYQCEQNKIYYFGQNFLDTFLHDESVSTKVIPMITKLAQGVFEKMIFIDRLISETAKNWSLDRINTLERAILRMAIYEFILKETPYKVVFDEAIELGKTFGTDQSGAFINGILEKAYTLLKDSP